jgi:hypothetical protein
MKNWQLPIAAVLVVAAATATPQDVKHAPTIESCVADINLWSSEIPTGWDPGAALKSLTANEIQGRRRELTECEASYPMLGRATTSGSSSNAERLQFNYEIEMETRFIDFLKRHDMLDKFKQEDQAGQR